MLDYQLEEIRSKYHFILASKTWNVEGAMQNAMGFSGGNDFTSAKEILQNLPIIGKVMEVKSKFGDVFKLSGQSNITDFESRLVWDSSRKPQFTVDYKFVNMSSGIADGKKGALAKAKQIHEAALPTKGTPAVGREGYFFRAPLGYKFASGSASGTLSLAVGKWFRASNLILKDASFTTSKEMMKGGKPLFVTGSFTLEPYQAITYNEFLGYFL